VCWRRGSEARQLFGRLHHKLGLNVCMPHPRALSAFLSFLLSFSFSLTLSLSLARALSVCLCVLSVCVSCTTTSLPLHTKSALQCLCSLTAGELLFGAPPFAWKARVLRRNKRGERMLMRREEKRDRARRAEAAQGGRRMGEVMMMMMTMRDASSGGSGGGNKEVAGEADGDIGAGWIGEA
jgi:hypothetical protein